MPCLKDADKTEITNNSLFAPVDYELWDEEIEEPHTSQHESRMSIRIIRGQHPVRYGKVYTSGALRSNALNQPWYKWTIFITCSMNN